MPLHLFLSITAFFALVVSLPCRAEEEKGSGSKAVSNPSRLQQGSIELEGYKKPTTDTYELSESGAAAYIKAVRDFAAGGGGASPIPSPSDSAIRYLAALYLHCSLAFGTCPSVLDAVLEGDLINSRLKKKADCPVSLRFWKKWIEDDMEQRQSHEVKTGYIAITNDFRLNERPRYIKCGNTIKAEIEGPNSDADYFKRRYAQGSKLLVSLEQAHRLAEQMKSAKMKEKVPDIFSAHGMK